MLFASPSLTLTYRNSRGRVAVLGFNTPFVITAGGGQENHINNVHGIPSPGRHGESGGSMRMDRRQIRLSGEVRGGSIGSETAREILHEAFNPTLSGTLTSFNSQTRVWREIDVVLDELPIVEWSPAKKCLVFEIMLVAKSPPFWRGNPLVVNIAQTMKKWSFPMAFPQHGSMLEGMIFGLRHDTLETRFDNMGNVDSGFTVTFRARGGTVVNPSIRNEENPLQQIRINYTMEPNDVIVIENYQHLKTVTLNGESAFHLLDAPETRFFLIQVGRNRIGYRADENVSNLQVRVRYTPEYTYVGGYDPVGMMASPYLAENSRIGELVENEDTGLLVSRLIPRG